MAGTISREELRSALARGDDPLPVGVLGAEYFRRSHLPGAINLPLEEIERVPQVLPGRGVRTVVYCMSPI